MSGSGVLGRQPQGVAGVPSQSGGSAGIWKPGWGRAGSSLGASAQGGQQLCLAFDTPCPPSCCPGHQAW